MSTQIAPLAPPTVERTVGDDVFLQHHPVAHPSSIATEVAPKPAHADDIA